MDQWLTSCPKSYSHVFFYLYLNPNDFLGSLFLSTPCLLSVIAHSPFITSTPRSLPDHLSPRLDLVPTLCNAMAPITFLIKGYTRCIIMTSLLVNNNTPPPPLITLKVEIAFVFLVTLYLEMTLISTQKVFMGRRKEGKEEKEEFQCRFLPWPSLAGWGIFGEDLPHQGPPRGREQKSLSVAFVGPSPCLLNCSYSCQQPPEEGKERGGERD